MLCARLNDADGDACVSAQSVEEAEMGQVEDQAQEHDDRTNASVNPNPPAPSAPTTFEQESKISGQLLPIFGWMLAYVQKQMTLEGFKEKLTNHLSKEHGKGIEQFLDALRTITPGQDFEASKHALDVFLDRVKAIEAGKAARQLQDNLL
jgi:hypothetical protein